MDEEVFFCFLFFFKEKYGLPHIHRSAETEHDFEEAVSSCFRQ